MGWINYTNGILSQQPGWRSSIIMLLGTIITALAQFSLVTAVSSVNHDEVGDGQGGQDSDMFDICTSTRWLPR